MTTKKRPNRRMTPEEQRARFVETAKQVEVDEAPDTIENAFRRLDVRKLPTISPRETVGSSKPRR
jgi:hypothetical protein